MICIIIALVFILCAIIFCIYEIRRAGKAKRNAFFNDIQNIVATNEENKLNAEKHSNKFDV